ncbi:MAG: transposase [Candidatus Thermoplasmatota archaeon]|nr:transposase [Candidatus Thermoplasmatota archaeon]MDI6855204.1 transposase [Candidatus Thermoplasmatota archaeon]
MNLKRKKFFISAQIGEIERFANSKKLCSDAGLVPSLKRSGGYLKMGHIPKPRRKWR